MGTNPHVIKKFPGLFTSCNPLEVPEGAQDVADNCAVRSSDLLESRRGYRLVTSLGVQIGALAWKQGQVLAFVYDNTDAGGFAGEIVSQYATGNGGATFSSMSPGGPPFKISQPLADVQTRTRFFSAQKALYFTSKFGLTKIEDILSQTFYLELFPAVHPPMYTTQLPGGFGYGAYVTGANGGTVNWLANNFQCAYRITICRKGANGELIESEPSERIILSNTSGSAAFGNVTIPASYMITGDSFVRIYRSVQVATTATPSDEMFLTSEATFSGPLGSDLYQALTGLPSGASYTDYTDDLALVGNPPLYSNLQSGTAPGRTFASAPAGKDALWFKNRAYYFNTTDVQRLTVTLIGTGFGGVVDGDTFSINGKKFIARASPSNAGTDYALSTGGTLFQNVDNTARKLVAAINEYYSQADTGPLQSKILARYLSTSQTAPGIILLQRLTPGSDSFTVQTNSHNGWASDYTTGVTSSANPQIAGLSWSEQFQPEAVPLANATVVGDASDAGQRVVALRDAALLYKTNDGVWKLTDDGTSIGPTVTLLDPTVKLVAPDTLQVIDSIAIGLCADGVIAMSEMGKVNLSHDQIERDLFKLMTYVGTTTLQRYAFGVAYAPEHTYLMALPESPTATSATIVYAYNTQTHAWTRWRFRLGVTAGSVNPDTGQLTWAMSDGSIWIERKAGDSTDYQDPGFTLTSPVSTATATMVFAGDLTQGTTLVEVGDVFQQFQATYALQQRVRSVVYSSASNQTTVTLDAAPTHPWTATPLTVVKAIRATVRFLPFHAQVPMSDKSWGTAFLSFRYLDQDWITVGFSSEKAQVFQNIEQVAGSDKTSPQGVIPQAVWPPVPWANTGANADFWGRRTQNVMLQVSIPQDFNPSAQLALTLSFANALERWELAGIDLKVMGVTERPIR